MKKQIVYTFTAPYSLTPLQFTSLNFTSVIYTSLPISRLHFKTHLTRYPPPLTTLYFTFISAIFTTLLVPSLHLTGYHLPNPVSVNMLRHHNCR